LLARIYGQWVSNCTTTLWQGFRGLRGGDSLAKLLRRHQSQQRHKTSA
jgi:hypothetical protein